MSRLLFTKSQSYKKSPSMSSKLKKRKRSKSISKKKRISGGACSDAIDPTSYEPVNEIPPLYRLSIPFKPANGVNESIEYCRDLRQLALDFKHGFTKNLNSQTEYTNDQLLYIYVFIAVNHVAIYNKSRPYELNDNIMRLHLKILNALLINCFKDSNIALFDFILVQPTHPFLRSLQKSGRWIFDINNRYKMPLEYQSFEVDNFNDMNTLFFTILKSKLQRGTRINFLKSLTKNVGIDKKDITNALDFMTLIENPYQRKKDAEDVEIVRLLLETIDINYAFDDKTYGKFHWTQMLDFYWDKREDYDDYDEAFNIIEYPNEIKIIDLFGQYGYQINNIWQPDLFELNHPPKKAENSFREDDYAAVWENLFSYLEDGVIRSRKYNELYSPFFLHRSCEIISQVWIPRGLDVNGLLSNGETPLAAANRLLGPGNELSQLLIANGGVVQK